MGLVLLLVLCAFQLVRADNSFPPIFTMSLNMPGLPENASNTMTVAWDSLNNRAAICAPLCTTAHAILETHLSFKGTPNSLPLAPCCSTSL